MQLFGDSGIMDILLAALEEWMDVEKNDDVQEDMVEYEMDLKAAELEAEPEDAIEITGEINDDD